MSHRAEIFNMIHIKPCNFICIQRDFFLFYALGLQKWHPTLFLTSQAPFGLLKKVCLLFISLHKLAAHVTVLVYGMWLGYSTEDKTWPCLHSHGLKRRSGDYLRGYYYFYAFSISYGNQISNTGFRPVSHTNTLTNFYIGPVHLLACFLDHGRKPENPELSQHICTK